MEMEDVTADQSSSDRWLCEVQWHVHTDSQRGPTCRPDSLRHPEATPTTQEPPR